jgi:acyl carrier protein phosphodiesterase
MNYLAHIYLSHSSPDAITGAMLGDFVKGRPSELWSSDIRRAIVLHRAIDRYTDTHELVRVGRGLVSAERRRFAGIIVDVVYDHFLARHWDRFHDRPLSQFTDEVYRTLLAQQAGLPERLQRILPWMAADDWLGSYGEVEGINASLNGIARRFKRPDKALALRTAVEELERNYLAFERNFLEFFPTLRAFVASVD